MRLPPVGRIALLAAACLSAAFADDPLAPLGKVATEWVKTRDQTVKEQMEWASQRELLQTTVAALQERAQALEDQRDLLKARTARNRAELAAMEQENADCRQRLRASEDNLARVDAALVALRPQMPPRLASALTVAYQSLGDAKLGPSERMQVTIAFLTRCEQFDHTVTVGEEVLALQGEAQPRLVDSIYWGLSHGYAYERSSGRAWLGRPTAGGWQWEACPQAAGAVRTMLAASRDQAEPQFVEVAAQLGEGAK